MKTLIILLLIFIQAALHAQQLYFEALTGINKTAYDFPAYAGSETYFSLGGRIAAGSDHFQVGGEFRTNITNPSFETTISKDEFSETYFGGILRGKISKYPAMRFGLVFLAGAGIYNTKLKSFTPPDSQEAFNTNYDSILGFNAGAGISIPVLKAVMFEMGYAYHFVQRPEIESKLIEEYKASFHSVTLGLSLNFVFGKRAAEYRRLRERIG